MYMHYLINGPVNMSYGLSGASHIYQNGKVKGSPYSITKHRVPEVILVLGSQPADGMSHKPGSRLPLLTARPTVTLATLKGAGTSIAAW